MECLSVTNKDTWIPVNTLVLTPLGDKPAYKLKVGDTVFDKDHIRTTVVELQTFTVPSYKVTLDNGITFYASNRQEFDNISLHQMMHDKTTFNTFEFTFTPCTHGFAQEIPVNMRVLAYLLSPAHSDNKSTTWFKLFDISQKDINFLESEIEIDAKSNEYLENTSRHNYFFKSAQLRTAFDSMKPNPIEFLQSLPLQDRKEFLKLVYANRVVIPDKKPNTLLELVASTGQSVKDGKLTSEKPKLKSIEEYYSQEMRLIHTANDNGVMTKNYIPY